MSRSVSGRKLNEDDISSVPAGYRPAFVERNQVPQGAIAMSETEVIELQQKIIKKAQLDERMWLDKSSYVTMISSILTSAVINAHFRRKFSIRSVGALATVPVLASPAITARIIDFHFSRKVLLKPDCQGCFEVRGGFANTCAVFLPSVLLSVTTAIYLSKKHHTYDIGNNFLPVVRHIVRTSPRQWVTCACLSAACFGIGALLRRKQREEIDYINWKYSNVSNPERVSW
ncbi:hypothetical protein ACF0H5_020275 [Mactra antiquata]